MSSADAITGALFYNAINRRSGRGNGGVPVSEYNVLIDKYNAQLKRAENFKQEYATLAKHFDISADNTHFLITYINAERMANNKSPLQISDVERIVKDNILLSSINDKITHEAVNSKIGIISESDKFWQHVSNVVYEPFAQQLKEMGKVGREMVLKSYDRESSIDSGESSRIAEMEKRIAELEQSNKALKDKNLQLTFENTELKQENMDLVQQGLDNMGIDLDSMVVQNYNPKK